MKSKDEITPLNHELYSDLSIDELEERLEMGCWVQCTCLLGSYEGCNEDGGGGGGGGGGCMAMPIPS